MKSAKFKDSPLGPIPQDWEVKRLGDLCEKIGSGATPLGGASSYCQTGIALIRSQNVVDTRFSFDGLAYINSDQADELSNVEVLSKDVLLNITGDSVARVCTVPDSVLPARVNQHVCIVRTIAKKCHYLYLAYRLVVEKKRLLAAAFGGGTRNALTKADVEAFTIPCPSLPEQQGIAEALGEVDKLIESLDAQIEKKRLIAKGVAHDLLSGKKRLPGFKGEWKRVRLGDIGEIIRGVSYSPNNAHSSFVDGTVKLLRANNVQEGRIIFNDLVYVDSQCVSQEQRMLRGDILICAANGSKELVGKAASIDYDFETTFGAFMMVLRPNSEITGKFLKHYFVSRQYRNQLDDVLTGSAINNLNGKAVCKFTVVLPVSLAEQQAIADLLSEQDAAIAALVEKREKYARIKEGMMCDLLTGKVRMKGE